MAENSKIEWTDHTFNPWVGCTKVSEGCKFCYAEQDMDKRRHFAQWGKQGTRRITSDANWQKPLAWNKAAQAAGERHRVFCASLADVFEGNDTMPAEAMANVVSARARLLLMIRDTPHLGWLLLTKRPENILPQLQEILTIAESDIEWAKAHYNLSPTQLGRLGSITTKWLDGSRIPENVWIGTSVENQEQADKRIPHLIRVPAVVRFLSCEPLLGAVDLDLTYECGYCDGQGGGKNPNMHDDGAWDCEQCYEGRIPYGYIHWVICGGESGSNARTVQPEWVRNLRDQCQEANVPFFFKQWGEYMPYELTAQPPFWAEMNGEEYDGHGLNIIDPDTCDAGKEWHEDSLSCEYAFRKVGKKAAGRLLDGRTWDEFPEVTR